MLDVLRPVAEGAILPNEMDAVIGTKVLADHPAGKEICWTDLGRA
jgi:hypothetical protein